MDIPNWHSTEMAVQGSAKAPDRQRKKVVAKRCEGDDSLRLFFSGTTAPKADRTLPTVCLTLLLCDRRQVGLIPVPP
jgi:hypothetical protein